jgi:AcrR family transcriptional regulator
MSNIIQINFYGGVMLNKRALKMAENKENLLSAARTAFSKYGFEGTSMDKLTAEVGLTRGALYHNFGDKKGLFAAVVERIDYEMAIQAKQEGAKHTNLWESLLAEGETYIKNALNPEVQRIVLLDGPAVLGDPSQWPSQNQCLKTTNEIVKKLMENKILKTANPETVAMFLNGAAMNAALWIAANDNPEKVLSDTLETFRLLANGLLMT